MAIFGIWFGARFRFGTRSHKVINKAEVRPSILHLIAGRTWGVVTWVRPNAGLRSPPAGTAVSTALIPSS